MSRGTRPRIPQHGHGPARGRTHVHLDGPVSYGIEYAGIKIVFGGDTFPNKWFMVWNITKDEIRERMAVSTEDAWSVPGTAVQPPPDDTLTDPMTS